MSVRLEDDTLGTLELSDAYGYTVAKVDLGFPAVRAASDDRVNANGADDTTAFYGPRAVSLDVAVYPVTGITRKAALDALRAYASPARRPVLYVDEENDGDERRVRLRGDQLGWPMEQPGSVAVNLAWVAPDGIIEAGTESSVTASAIIPDEAGRTYPRTYPLTYPAESITGAANAINAGTEPVAPLLALWGPATDPQVENLSTGDAIVFTGLTLTADQYAEVDVREATARLNGFADQSLYSSLDFTASAFFWLTPGDNQLRYSAAAFSTGARAVITYRSAWL